MAVVRHESREGTAFVRLSGALDGSPLPAWVAPAPTLILVSLGELDGIEPSALPVWQAWVHGIEHAGGEIVLFEVPEAVFDTLSASRGFWGGRVRARSVRLDIACASCGASSQQPFEIARLVSACHHEQLPLACERCRATVRKDLADPRYTFIFDEHLVSTDATIDAIVRGFSSQLPSIPSAFSIHLVRPWTGPTEALDPAPVRRRSWAVPAVVCVVALFLIAWALAR